MTKHLTTIDGCPVVGEYNEDTGAPRQITCTWQGLQVDIDDEGIAIHGEHGQIAVGYLPFAQLAPLVELLTGDTMAQLAMLAREFAQSIPAAVEPPDALAGLPCVAGVWHRLNPLEQVALRAEMSEAISDYTSRAIKEYCKMKADMEQRRRA